MILASVCNTFMDLSSEGKLRKKWNKEYSWKNKYKDGTLEPKFFLSTTVFVWITDFWHFMKFIMLKLLFLSIVLYSPAGASLEPVWYPVFDFLVMWASFGATHEVVRRFYMYYKKRNENN